MGLATLYNLGIACYGMLLRLAAPFHAKARAFCAGRKDIFKQLEAAFAAPAGATVWVHCASVGEFEQARPVMEALRARYPEYRLLLTFFSPSGYEACKHYHGCDFVFYLPLDTPKQARRFVETVKPKTALFVKYEFWPNYTRVLREHGASIISFSAAFRDKQIFFRPWGVLGRKTLRLFDYFFVQEKMSLQLLRSIGIERARVSGDTRFDRVREIATQTTEILIAAAFCGKMDTWIIGSCWPADMGVLLPFINQHKEQKFIIVPHEIDEDFLAQIERGLTRSHIRYSQAQTTNIGAYEILIVNQIGLLSRLYRYAAFAYVGGGFGKGLHNILEAAVYGIPVFFGNSNYQKFNEARALIAQGVAFAVGDTTDLTRCYETLTPKKRKAIREVTLQYITEQAGATQRIMDGLAPFLDTHG